jgi:hypothetical protein
LPRSRTNIEQPSGSKKSPGGYDDEVREQLTGGVRHAYEARLKEQRRSHGRRHHEADPGA